MVAALPGAEKDKLLQLEQIGPHHFSNLGKIWKNLLNRWFQYNPGNYMGNLQKAKNQGTIDIVKEIIHEDKIPLSL